jgi:hypothetical protein
MNLDQNAQSTPQPSTGMTLDLSKSIPVVDAPAPASAASSQSPAGVTLDLSKSTPVVDAPDNSFAARVARGATRVGTGIAEGAGDTVSGVAHLIHKIPGVGEDLSPAQGTAALDKMDVSNSTGESVGKGVEGIAEFMLGDEALSGLAKGTKFVALANKYPLIADTLDLAKSHPWLANMITGSGKAATVGAAQGAVKGAQEDDAVGGMLKGAAGGAIGGAIGGAFEPIKWNPFNSLQRAIRPTGNLARGFAEKAELAMPRLAAEHVTTPITNLDELSEVAHTAAEKLWTTEVIPQIQKHTAEIIPGKPVADAIRKGVSAGDADLFPEGADAAETFAKKFDVDMNLQQASDRLQSLNRKLSSLYKMDPASRYAATANSPTVEAMESGADELRQQIYAKLESLGEKDPAGLRKTYGALKTVQQAAEKRAIVVGRAAPINLAQQLATAAGVLHAAGHLAIGDVPGAAAGAAPIIAAKATKVINSPEYQIGKTFATEGSGVVRRAASKLSGPAVSQAAQAIPPSEDDEQQ